MRVICISGKAGAGKDTYAAFLKEELESDGHRVLITHYADLLKHVCEDYFDWDGIKDEHGRWLLQYVGTNVVRKSDPDLWAEMLMRLVSALHEFAGWDFVIIPDARFENELQCVEEFGFWLTHIRVERPGCDSNLTDAQKNHPSETGLDDVMPDLIVDNKGDLDDLREAASTSVVWLTGLHQLRMPGF